MILLKHRQAACSCNLQNKPLIYIPGTVNLLFILIYEHCSWLLSLAGQQAEHPNAQGSRGFVPSALSHSWAIPLWFSHLKLCFVEWNNVLGCKGHKRPFSSKPSAQQQWHLPLKQVAQTRTQPGVEHFQGWGTCSFCGRGADDRCDIALEGLLAFFRH